jgi:diguanylate cyclase (GGDEF)-like protein
MDEKIKELEEKIKKLEKELEAYRKREEELESVIEEYNNLVKKQFEYFENFLSALGSNEFIDPLTRTLKKEFALKLLDFYYQRYFESSKEFALVFVDVDKFEEINTRYGKDKGDKVLVELAKTLKKCVRIPLDSVSRFGADEFVVILSEVTKEQSIKIAQRIHKECNSISVNQIDFSVTTSVVHFPSDKGSVSDILELGEELLNRSKAERTGGLKYLG